MDKTPPKITGSEIDDAATFKLALETDGVQRKVILTVSPRPIDASEWAAVVKALSDFVAEYPERF